MITGGWPQQLQRQDPRFVADYLEQTGHVDINSVAGGEDRQVQRRRDLDKVLMCIRSLARNVATAAGVRTVAADTGLSRDAVTDYVAALQRLMIVEDHEIDIVVQRPSGVWGAIEVKLGGEGLIDEGRSHCSPPSPRSTCSRRDTPRSWQSSRRHAWRPSCASSGAVGMSCAPSLPRRTPARSVWNT